MAGGDVLHQSCQHDDVQSESRSAVDTVETGEVYVGEGTKSVLLLESSIVNAVRERTRSTLQGNKPVVTGFGISIRLLRGGKEVGRGGGGSRIEARKCMPLLERRDSVSLPSVDSYIRKVLPMRWRKEGEDMDMAHIRSDGWPRRDKARETSSSVDGDQRIPPSAERKTESRVGEARRRMPTLGPSMMATMSYFQPGTCGASLGGRARPTYSMVSICIVSRSGAQHAASLRTARLTTIGVTRARVR